VPPLFAYRLANNLASDLLRCPQEREPGGALLTFVPTLSDGLSPALKHVIETVNREFGKYIQPKEMLLWR
jgi:hypothetical protein